MELIKMSWPQRVARRGFWATVVVVALNFALLVANVATNRSGWAIIDFGGLCVSSGSAVIWRRLIPERTAPPPEPNRHELCLAEIGRLERELALDGVHFLMTPDEFDRAVEHATTGRVGVNADPAAIYNPPIYVPPNYVPRPEPERNWNWIRPKDSCWPPGKDSRAPR